MRIQYHYCLENKWGLEKFLNTNEISYEKTDEWLDGDSLLIFDLYEDEKVYTKFKIHYLMWQCWMRIKVWCTLKRIFRMQSG